MTDLIERWLPVVGYEGLYEVSDLGRAKLTEAQVIKIREEASSLKKLQLARKYEVSTKTIHNVINRKIWRHI